MKFPIFKQTCSVVDILSENTEKNYDSHLLD